ncbi:Dymeclin [Phytophthora nicotianae]|uniref:Dymeclin n=1 Tax=Phytophthora nicotianae TaxID=4792 RepID=A0A0W8CF45_PHYNI|nr:Dymeclin [Phytophthora nicotianae]
MYPLPVQPYPSRALNANETNLLRRFTNTLTAAALHDYDCFVKDCHGDVSEDTRHDWKFVKKQGGLAVYRDRDANARHNEDTITMAETNGRISSQEHQPPGQIESLLCIGTLPGTLDDIMCGIVCPTAQDTMLKSSCIGDNIVDCCVLASILSPTPEDPWRSLTLKWAVNAGPNTTRPLVRPRDFTYVEATGITTNIDGERVGYHIVHSVVVPDTQPIDKQRLVRGNVSLYHVYRQKSPNTVEVHVRAFWQLNGHTLPSIQTSSCVEATISISRVRLHSRMKKLVWLSERSQSLDTETDSSCCNLCKRWVGGCFTVDRCCSVCQSVACRRCSTSELLHNFSKLQRTVIRTRQTVCRRCLRKSEESIAMQESKPVKRTKLLSSRALSTASTASLDSRDWNCSERSRVFSSRRFEGAATSGAGTATTQ